MFDNLLNDLLSTHLYPFYPGTDSMKEIGKGKAGRTTVNILLKADVCDEGFKLIYERIVIPALEKFNPDLMLVSAGFDEHWDEP